ncbi:MAG: DNA mismatch repair protein MutS [Oligoflexia bacterium]|nr:DNA mismatch repair protein MutS [Oligoflexia bacterium]
METPKLTPLMQQYWDIKNQHTDKILLFRMGDFYEMFFDDAIKAAPLLNIALTSRNKTQGNDTPMCGVPHHSIGSHINKLLRAGLKVAICDQVEDAKDAKTIVKRAVTRVVTPGIVYDPETLDSASTNFVATILSHGDELYSLACVDASTGEVLEGEGLSLGELSTWIQKLSPQEYLIDEKITLPFTLSGVITNRSRLKGQSASDFLIQYVKEMQGPDVVKTLRVPQPLQKDFLKISATTIRHLELFKTSEGEKEGSLFSTIDCTKSPMGARVLKKRLACPFLSSKEINTQLDLVNYFYENEVVRKNLRQNLALIGDLERKVAKLSNPLCNARDLQALAKALTQVISILSEEYAKEYLSWNYLNKNLDQDLKLDSNSSSQEIKVASNISSRILETLQDELPHSTKEGSLIKPGINSTLDEYVVLSTHAQTLLSELEAKERKNSGIQSLKVKYNSVFGYSLEITKANLEKVPAHFVRRQTLAQAERFVTTELSDLEQKILSSQQKRCDLEYQLFSDLKQLALSQAISFLNLSTLIAQIDLSQGFAHLAYERRYVRPQFIEGQLKIIQSRHPVLEQIMSEPFIPNDIYLNQGQCLLLTGPNMAGKSTLMRQTALTAILAQSGSFVPAAKAFIPLFDHIFTRIGASDNLSRGLSTFMVEMTETAEIIKDATPKSLVILDEIGRGTSTYDGMSLAQSVLEYFLSNISCFTFFATHYHELTELDKDFKNLLNGHMSIQEFKGQLVFLRKLVSGAANRSYGIDVAKQAGLPKQVTDRAQMILKGLVVKSKQIHQTKQLNLLEQMDVHDNDSSSSNSSSNDTGILAENEMLILKVNELQRLNEKFKVVINSMHETKVESLTPLDALNRFAQIQKTINAKDLS